MEDNLFTSWVLTILSLKIWLECVWGVCVGCVQGVGVGWGVCGIDKLYPYHHRISQYVESTECAQSLNKLCHQPYGYGMAAQAVSQPLTGVAWSGLARDWAARGPGFNLRGAPISAVNFK